MSSFLEIKGEKTQQDNAAESGNKGAFVDLTGIKTGKLTFDKGHSTIALVAVAAVVGLLILKRIR